VRRSLGDPEFRGLFVLVVVTLAAGTLFYWQIEGWSPLDAFYFSSITLTTVGYGDLAPETAAGKLFTVFYLFTGIGLIVAFLNAVARTALEQREEKRGLLGRRNRSPEDE
jgi:voltage-gated potassium channel